MKLSTKGKYGLKAMYELHCQSGTGAVPLKTLAEKQGLSEHYLEQLVGPLRKAGLIKSVRGAHGGYTLGRPASSITVGEIIRVLEGPIALSDCVSGGEEVHHCGEPNGCVARRVLEKVRDVLCQVLDGITLESLDRRR